MAISHKIKGFLSSASFIRKMFEEGEKLRKIHGPEHVYDYTLGNPDAEPPAAFKEELKKLALEPEPGMHRYMSNAGYSRTRCAVAAALASSTLLPFSENNIVMTCGAGGALNVVLKTILDPGDEIIIISPFFVEYKFYIDNHGGLFVIAPSTRDFQLDLKAINAAVTPRTRAVLINSPNNPTGVIYGEESLKALGELLETKEQLTGQPIYVISDEPYAKIVYDGIALPSVFRQIKNSIVVTSHSKDLALPGERIGYIAFSPRIEESALLEEGLSFCNRTLGFVNAPALMQRLVAGLQDESVNIQKYQEKRDILYNALTELGFKMIKPQGAFYLFPESPLPDDVEFIRIAQKYNLLLVPGSGFGRPGYFRMAYCIDKQLILNSLPAFKSLAFELGLTR